MRLEIATKTMPGSREINEDYVAYRLKDDALIAVVADGLGGHDKGEVASEHVATYIVEHYSFEEPLQESLGKVIKAAQLSLLERQKAENSRKNAMKTTVVVLVIKGKTAYFAHVGDSRGYCFRKFRRYSRTIDHSVPQYLVLAGDIKEEEIRHHSQRSSLLRVLGTPWEKDAFELSKKISLKSARAFLLCSDGFWELIDEKAMQKLLKRSASPDEWVAAMTERVEQNGRGTKMDNFTACAVFVMEE